MDFARLDTRMWTILLAGACTTLTLYLTRHLVSQHLLLWRNPTEQRAILIIILMAPIYALDSFLGLVKFQGSASFFMFLDAIKECYGALVISKFLSLLYSYVGISIRKHVIPENIKGRKILHAFPLTLVLPREVPLDEHSLKLLKWGTWQFVIIRPVLSVVMIVLQLLGLYEGAITWIITLILNVSVYLAMNSMLDFYHLFGRELAPHKPFLKFLCIKGVVFFSFWQEVTLKVLVVAGIIRSEHCWLEIAQIEGAYFNLLVCVEMVLFSFLQQYAFHVSEYSRQHEVVEDKKDR